MYPRKRFLSYVFLAAVAFTGWQCSDDDSAPEEPAKSTGKSITSFKFSALAPVVTATIDEAAKTIAATVPAGTSITALVPTVDISEEATVAPASGAAQNFTTPVTYTVTAEDGSKQAYTVTVTVAEGEVTCYPTALPSSDAIMFITYNTDHKVAGVSFREIGAESDSDYRSEFEYTDGKISRVNYLYADVLENYVVFTYRTGKIVETYFGNSSGDFEAEHYYIYYLDGSRVTGWAYHSVRENPGETRLDSAVFTYTDDNVTRMDGYGAGDVLQWYHTFEYDDKLNPYKLTGLTGDDDEYFHPITLSKNNITRETRYQAPSDPQESTTTYTYDDNGFPLTRAVDGDPALTFEYECK